MHACDRMWPDDSSDVRNALKQQKKTGNLKYYKGDEKVFCVNGTECPTLMYLH